MEPLRLIRFGNGARGRGPTDRGPVRCAFPVHLTETIRHSPR